MEFLHPKGAKGAGIWGFGGAVRAGASRNANNTYRGFSKKNYTLCPTFAPLSPIFWTACPSFWTLSLTFGTLGPTVWTFQPTFGTPALTFGTSL